MVWYSMVWYGIVWYGMVWYCTVWHGMVWPGSTVIPHLQDAAERLGIVVVDGVRPLVELHSLANVSDAVAIDLTLTHQKAITRCYG